MANNTTTAVDKKKQTEIPVVETTKQSDSQVTSETESPKTPLYSAAEKKVDNDAVKVTTPVQTTSAPPTTTPSTQPSLVTSAIQKLDGNLAPYTSKWQGNIDKTLSAIENKTPFSYDLNGDILYHQYAEQFGRNAEKAMKNTVGQVSALSGGYGNSYAQTAGQQAYADTMSGLNDVIPQLYQLALNKYNQEQQNQKDMLSIYQSMDNADYGRYIDDRNLAYQQGRDAVSDSKWQTSFDYGVDSDSRNLALTMLTSGVMPDNTLLEKAGITPEQAQTWAGSVVTDKYKMDYQEQTDLRNYVVSLLSSGVTVDDDTIKKAGISKNEATGLLNAAKASVSSGGGSGTAYTSTQIKQMFKDGDYDSLMRALVSMGGDVYENAQKRGISKHEVDYINDNGKITSLEQAKYLLNNYKKDNTPSSVNVNNAMSEAHFYATSNMSEYDTYSDYLTGMFGKYIDWMV